MTEYWQHEYDWREHETTLNEYLQFTTEIDSQQIHFLDVLGPLIDPDAHDGELSDAFHVVVPSIPGFGFLGPTTERGWDTACIARAFTEPMVRLGYEDYGAQGGDVGAGMAPELGRIDADRVVVHVNAATAGFIPYPPFDPDEAADHTDAEQERFECLEHFMNEQFGYHAIQSNRTRTLAYGLTDSPVGLLPGIVEKFVEWTDAPAELPQDAVDRDHLLTNLMLYWLTNTDGSAARLYYEDAHASPFAKPAEPSDIPTGVAVFN